MVSVSKWYRCRPGDWIYECQVMTMKNSPCFVGPEVLGKIDLLGGKVPLSFKVSKNSDEDKKFNCNCKLKIYILHFSSTSSLCVFSLFFLLDVLSVQMVVLVIFQSPFSFQHYQASRLSEDWNPRELSWGITRSSVFLCWEIEFHSAVIQLQENLREDLYIAVQEKSIDFETSFCLGVDLKCEISNYSPECWSLGYRAHLAQR